MIIVSDTSPLSHLAKVAQLSLAKNELVKTYYLVDSRRSLPSPPPARG
jgi:hypothetical protein